MGVVSILADRVAKASNGRLILDYVGGPEVIPGFDQPDAVRMGTIDAVFYIAWGYMKPLVPEAWAEGLSQYPAWEEREEGIYDLWDEIFQKRLNSKYIGKFESVFEFFHLFSNVEIKSIEDLKGLTFRAMPLYVPFMESMGMSPVIMPAPDMYTAMERGVIDGLMFPKDDMVGFALHEVTKYRIDPGLGQSEPATLVNLDVWNKIPKDLQDILLETMAEMEYMATSRRFWRASREVEIAKDAGVKVITLSREETKELVRLFYDKIWEPTLKDAPEYGPRLKELLSR